MSECKIIFEFSRVLERPSCTAHLTGAIVLTLQKAAITTQGLFEISKLVLHPFTTFSSF